MKPVYRLTAREAREPAGFPEMPPVVRDVRPLPAALDTDVVAFEAQIRPRLGPVVVLGAVALAFLAAVALAAVALAAVALAAVALAAVALVVVAGALGAPW